MAFSRMSNEENCYRCAKCSWDFQLRNFVFSYFVPMKPGWIAQLFFLLMWEKNCVTKDTKFPSVAWSASQNKKFSMWSLLRIAVFCSGGDASKPHIESMVETYYSEMLVYVIFCAKIKIKSLDGSLIHIQSGTHNNFSSTENFCHWILLIFMMKDESEFFSAGFSDEKPKTFIRIANEHKNYSGLLYLSACSI